MAKIRAVHLLNQFFGGIGGEEQADVGPRWFDGARGPGKLICTMAPDIEVIGTIVVGDNYRADAPEDAAKDIVDLLIQHCGDETSISADLFIAGPAFNAGRYGMRCAASCKAVEARLGIAAVTALFPENPAVSVYRRSVTIVRAGADVMDMRGAAERMVRVGLKRIAGEPISPSSDETISRGLRQNYFAEKTGAERAIDMLLRKIAGDDPGTEYVMPVFERVPPAAPLPDMSTATIALVTTGGIVPKGNPDHIESASASRYGEYSLAGVAALTAETHQTVHGGYDPTYANADPNRVLPVDVMRELEREGRIGKLYETYFATVGNATSVERAVRFGAEIAAKLVNVGSLAVILTST